MKQLIVLSTLVVSFFPFLNFTQQSPTSKTFKAEYYAESNMTVQEEVYFLTDTTHRRQPCPNSPSNYMCVLGSDGFPCGFPKSCPVNSPFKIVPCPQQPGATGCAAASSGTGCANPVPCPGGLTYHQCPLDPNLSMCASGGGGVVCTTPSGCPIPPFAPETEEIKF